MTAPMEYHKDIVGGTAYASRNYNDLSQTYKVEGSNRTQLDWNMTLRQQRKKGWSKDGGSASAPRLMTSHGEESFKPKVIQAKGEQKSHIDGPYHTNTETVGKYQNYADTNHMCRNLTRTSSGTAQTVDWQLNLRDSYHKKPDDQWRRYFTRPQQSFDLMAENCSKSHEKYQTSPTTPQDIHSIRQDRRTGAISIETIRDDPISFKRNPGCEGTQVGQWEHLITDRRYGHKARKQLAHETTLRSQVEDPNGARIEDTRSDGCIVEMLGKKKWFDSKSYEPLAKMPPDGDPKLHHLSRRRILGEQDDENRKLRMNKSVRSDAHLSDKHTGKMRKEHKDD